MQNQSPSHESLSVIIVNWNSGSHLEKCINSLLTYSPNAHLVIIDNASTDNSLSFLCNYPNIIDTVYLSLNIGFAAACNLGASKCFSKYLLFLNPDAAVRRNSISDVISFMDSPEHQHIGICGVQLYDSFGNLAHSCSRFPTVTRLVATSFGLDKLFHSLEISMKSWDHLSSRCVDQVIGAFFLTRRSIFCELRGFDESFFVYYEEVDYSNRVKKAGYETYYLASTSAFHVGGGTTNSVRDIRLFYMLRSRLIFSRKNFALFGHLLVSVSILVVELAARSIHAFITGGFSFLFSTLMAYYLLYRYIIVRR